MRKVVSQTAGVVVAAAVVAAAAGVPCAAAEEAVTDFQTGESVAAPLADPADGEGAAGDVDEPTYDDVDRADDAPSDSTVAPNPVVPDVPAEPADTPAEPEAPSDERTPSDVEGPAEAPDGQGPSNAQVPADAPGQTPETKPDDAPVATLSLSASASLSASSVAAGTSVTVTPQVSGASGDVTFNYVWERDNWRSWGSDKKESGTATASTSKAYTFLVPGTYHLYVDVLSGGGTVTVDAGTVVVQDTAWDVNARLNTSQACPGSTVTLDVQTSGITGDLRLNYVWERDGWQDWDSSLRRGGYSDARQWSFAPTQAGTYTLYVDVADSSGCVRTLTVGKLIVADGAWEASLGLSSEKVQKGGTFMVTPSVAGTDASGFTYNYVWNYEGKWAEWGSTVKDTGSSTARGSWEFAPKKAGRYDLYVDVKSPSGVTRTISKSVQVDPTYSFDWVTCSKSYARPGQTVTVKPEVSGDTAGVTYNYVWNYEGNWSEWGSTVKDGGSATSQSSWDFTPSKAGNYTLYVDVIGPDGYTVTQQTKLVVWNAAGLTAVPSNGNASWTVSCDLGSVSPDGFMFNYVWKKGSNEGDWSQWGSTVSQEGGMTSQASHTFTFTQQDYYWLYIDVTDPEGNKATVQKKVGYFSSGKTGYQNPSSMYQVSSFNVAPNPNAYGVFSYMTPSRISENATRAECVEAFVGRAYDYLGTSYVWNYACAPGVGVDCVGLVMQCAYAVGMDLGEFNPYDHFATGSNGWHSHDAKNMWDYGKIQRLPTSQRQRGDLIFYPGHVSIYLGNDTVIEALPPVVKTSNMWDYGTPLGVGRLFA